MPGHWLLTGNTLQHTLSHTLQHILQHILQRTLQHTLQHIHGEDAGLWDSLCKWDVYRSHLFIGLICLYMQMRPIKISFAFLACGTPSANDIPLQVSFAFIGLKWDLYDRQLTATDYNTLQFCNALQHTAAVKILEDAGYLCDFLCKRNLPNIHMQSIKYMCCRVRCSVCCRVRCNACVAECVAIYQIYTYLFVACNWVLRNICILFFRIVFTFWSFWKTSFLCISFERPLLKVSFAERAPSVACHGVATISRLLQIIGLFCRMSSLL